MSSSIRWVLIAMPDIQQITQIPWGRILILFFIVYLIFCMLAAFYADRILFPYPSPPTCKEEDVDFYLTTQSDIKIACAHQAPTKANGLVVLFSHGNGEDLGNLAPFIDYICEKGIGVIAYDYPGYGLSEGKPSESGCYEAIDAAYEHLTQELGVKPDRIVVWGRSLGTGPSCYLASTSKIGGLLLETPFLSAFRTVTEIPVLPWDRFRNLGRIQDITCPSLVIHGQLDEVIPFRQGRKIFKELPEPKSFLDIPTASHNDLHAKGGERYESAIDNFLNQLDED